MKDKAAGRLKREMSLLQQDVFPSLMQGDKFVLKVTWQLSGCWMTAAMATTLHSLVQPDT